MTTSQDKLLSKIPRESRLLQLMSGVKSKSLERMEVTEKSKLIMKQSNLETRSTLLSMVKTMKERRVH